MRTNTRSPMAGIGAALAAGTPKPLAGRQGDAQKKKPGRLRARVKSTPKEEGGGDNSILEQLLLRRNIRLAEYFYSTIRTTYSNKAADRVQRPATPPRQAAAR